MEEQILAVDLSTEQTLEVNLPEQDNVSQIDVYWQDEVTLDLDLSLMYIVSGQREIQDYVDNKSKPEIDEYIELNAKPIVAKVVEQEAKPIIDEYFENTVKPSITGFAEEEMAGYAATATAQVALATEQAGIATAQAGLSEASALAAVATLTSVNNKAVEFDSTVNAAKSDIQSATEASKTEFINFAQEKTEEFEQNAEQATNDLRANVEKSRIWAEGEQAEVKPLGGSLSSMGAADLAYAIANAPEDTPIDTSGLFAMNIVKGEKGDKGDKGEDAEPFDAKGFLNLIYPVGSIYISTTTTCPIANYGVGTWELVGKDRVLQGAGTRGNVNATINAGLPNITGSYTPKTGNDDTWSPGTYSGALYQLTSGQKGAASSDYTQNVQYGVGFDASRSNSIYGKSTTVQPDAYLVNIFRRIS